MTELCTYICDTCGKEFDNEEDCRKHEMEHTIAPLKNAVVVFDAGGTILPLDDMETAASFSTAIYVKNEEAEKALWEAFSKEGYCSPAEDIETPIRYPAFFVYNDRDIPYWTQFSDIEEEYNRLLELKATAEKALLN